MYNSENLQQFMFYIHMFVKGDHPMTVTARLDSVWQSGDLEDM